MKVGNEMDWRIIPWMHLIVFGTCGAITSKVTNYTY